MTELALALDIDPLELRRRNIDPARRRTAGHRRPPRRRRVHRGRPGGVHRPGRRAPCSAAPTGTRSATTGWSAPAPRVRSTRPRRPTEHISEAWATLRDDGIYEIAVGTVEFGEGTSTAHVQIAASVLGTTPSRVHLVQSDTDRTGFDTGAFASAGLFVSGNAVQKAATALRDSILRFAAGHAGVDVASCSMDDDGVDVRRRPVAAGRAAGGGAGAAGSGSPCPARHTARRAA